MTSSTGSVSPLRLRMIEDMRMRNLTPKTQCTYVGAVRRLEAYLKRPARSATAEDLRQYQLNLVDRGIAPASVNLTLTALRFFFETTLGRAEVLSKVQSLRAGHKLPVVLSREEVAALLAATPNIGHRTALSVAYGAGLRVSEVIRLRVADIDSERMALRVEQGKGHKDRYAMLSPVLLEQLRVWWKAARAEGRIRADSWLFPGANPLLALTARQLNEAVHDAAAAAGIGKRVTMHTLRHSFATHLLEQKVDIRVIQILLGHKRLETTSMYAHVATGLLREVISPIDTLPPR